MLQYKFFLTHKSISYFKIKSTIKTIPHGCIKPAFEAINGYCVCFPVLMEMPLFKTVLQSEINSITIHPISADVLNGFTTQMKQKLLPFQASASHWGGNGQKLMAEKPR